MYSDVVMEKSEGIDPEPGKGIREQLEGYGSDENRGVTDDAD